MDSESDRARHGHHSHQQHSNSELLSSAKLVAQAAQSTFRHESHKVDKAKVANAAGDLLEAASHYGKLEEKSFGKYVDKAQDYLHKYGGAGAGGHSEHSAAASHSAKPDHHESHGDKHSGGGYEDYMKMAQGFMKSDHSGSDSHSSKPGSHGDGEGKYGDYLKMAQGFLKK